jgi:uncharacterized ferredoxin-like protein
MHNSIEFFSAFLTAVELIAISARLSLRSNGSDAIKLGILILDQFDPFVIAIKKIATTIGMKFFFRDAENIK